MPKYSKERKHLEETAESRKKEKKRIRLAKLRIAIKKAGGRKAYKRKQAEARRRIKETKKLIQSSKAEDDTIKGIMEYTRGKAPKRPPPKPKPKPSPPKPKAKDKPAPIVAIPSKPKALPKALPKATIKPAGDSQVLYKQYMEAKKKRQEAEKKRKEAEAKKKK